MAQNELDEKVLSGIGLSDLSDQEKAVMLKLLDDRLEKRFIANLLMSLPEDKRSEFEQKVEAMAEPTVEGALEAAINIHPNAQGVLEKSAKEIIDEFKSAQGQVTQKSPVEQGGEQPPQAPPAETPPPATPQEAPQGEGSQIDSQAQFNAPSPDYYQPTSAPTPSSGETAAKPETDAQDQSTDSTASTPNPPPPLETPGSSPPAGGTGI